MLISTLQAENRNSAQDLSLHVVDVLIAVGGVNDLGTGINEGINLFAFQSLYRSFHCLIAHVVAELGDIHAERTVLDGGDSGGIAVKAAHDGIGIRLLSINAEKLHFPQQKVQLSWRRQRDLNSRADFSTYSLSRGAPSPAWVCLHVKVLSCTRSYPRSNPPRAIS